MKNLAVGDQYKSRVVRSNFWLSTNQQRLYLKQIATQVHRLIHIVNYIPHITLELYAATNPPSFLKVDCNYIVARCLKVIRESGPVELVSVDKE